MSDRISRIFINSNYKTNILDNHGDFGIDLPLGVIIEAGSHIQIAGFVVSHVWPTLDLQNSHLFVREVFEGTSYHRVIQLTTGNYNIATLAVEVQAKLRQGSNISDGFWSATSSDEGTLTIAQSSPSFTSARIFSASDIAGFTSVDSSSSFAQAWAAADVTEDLPRGGDASTMIGIPLYRLAFSPVVNEHVTGHVDLARYRVLHLCSPDLPNCSLSPHGRNDICASLVIAGSQHGSLVHNGFGQPPLLYCANSRQLRHLKFTVRDSADHIVRMPHAIQFELCITRAYE